ncbi:uncharacterized protein LTR77_001854 [Saxophila tyrrhenica]|uniref:Uncharacterized protein n=1 Tax=Saxophila tyrrhenica TaxID=1690608 RepID=A0AAV9PPE0_9PEZI|nr:hypothetical protein LTR77_001854 [Saxophila tyrrhenica]
MRRLSHNQKHRLPGWAKTAESRDVYIKNHDPTSQERSPGDYGIGNFSYSMHHLKEHQIQGDAAHLRPHKLLRDWDDFTYAEAAIMTAVDRIQGLDEDAPHRTNPRSSHYHLLSRRPSEEGPTTTGADSTASSFSLLTPTTTNMTPIPESLTYKLPLQHPKPYVSVDMRGLESPPFTPVDSRAVNTPYHNTSFNADTEKSTAPDLLLVNGQLIPLSGRRPSTTTTRAPNELAWESYLSTLEEELWGLRHNDLMRLKGYRDSMKSELKWLQVDGKISREEEWEFNKWLNGKVYTYQTLVGGMEEKIKATSCGVTTMATDDGEKGVPAA